MSNLGFLQEFETIVKNLPTDSGSDDPFAHYVDRDDMMRALVYGETVMALCGKIWLPSRDGSAFPVCSECQEIYDSIPDGGGHDDGDE